MIKYELVNTETEQVEAEQFKLKKEMIYYGVLKNHNDGLSKIFDKIIDYIMRRDYANNNRS